MRLRIKRILLALLGVYIAFGMAVEGYRFIDDQRVDREMERIRKLALADTSNATTFGQARDWLKGHDFPVVLWSPDVASGFIARHSEWDSGEPAAHKERRVVVGHRILRLARWPVKASWVNVTFRFTPEGQFEEVVVEKTMTSWPSTQRAH